MEKLKQLSQIIHSDFPSVTDTSFPELVSTSDSGDESGREEDKEKHGQGYGRKSKDPNLSGISKKTKRISQSISKRDKTSDIVTREVEDNTANEPSLRNQKVSEADVLDEKTKAQIEKTTERTMEEILATKRSLLEAKEPLEPRDNKVSELRDDPYAYDEKV